MEPTTRKQAKAQGRKFYTTGKPCKRGLIAPRRTCNRQCLCEACSVHEYARQARYRAAQV